MVLHELDQSWISRQLVNQLGFDRRNWRSQTCCRHLYQGPWMVERYAFRKLAARIKKIGHSLMLLLWQHKKFQNMRAKTAYGWGSSLLIQLYCTTLPKSWHRASTPSLWGYLSWTWPPMSLLWTQPHSNIRFLHSTSKLRLWDEAGSRPWIFQWYHQQFIEALVQETCELLLPPKGHYLRKQDLGRAFLEAYRRR